MTTTALHPVDDFANAVRAALADLPADEVDDLTDGLEADLAERASDQDSPDFGDPVAYASELRSAAGLPPRDSGRLSSTSSVLGAAWTNLLAGLQELQKHPLISRLTSFFVSLRPLWWMFRAWVFYGILTWVFGLGSLSFNLANLVVGTASIIVSVQLGRGKWLPRAWMRTALLVANVLLVLTIPVVILATTYAFGRVNDAYAESYPQQDDSSGGLTYNGKGVTNIFAYDAAGQPLTNVQLFDQDGKPLDTVSQPGSITITDYPAYLVPNDSVVGRAGWNIYPLLRVSDRDLTENGLPKPGAKHIVVKPKYATVPPLGSPAPSSTPTPTPTATPTPVPTP
jgi:hypothetical protein